MERYSTKKINENFYLIMENYAEDSSLVMGLFIGQNMAALIDSGMGMFGSRLSKIVAGLTDKPVINILTHGHPDHIAGSVLFDEVYMNRRDDDQISRLTPEKRLGDTKMFSHNDAGVLAEAEGEVLDCSGFQYRNVEEGDDFDLGGLTLKILALPGHSMGSIAIWCPELEICMVGDAFSPNVAASSIKDLSQFRSMADHIDAFLTIIPEQTILYGGHWTEPIPWSRVEDEKMAARELAERKTGQDEDIYLPISPVPNQKRHIYGSVSISYNPAILEKQGENSSGI